ncbi:hypothetical protein ACFXKW_02340 [Streptomyces sp. NPDC059193]|uniref:hypothetical protein n=1 Tax=Streptomyces sp. NPDC059193 TaxID=3346763 RepID=UPI003676DB23
MRRSRVLGATALALAIGLGGPAAVPAAAGPTAAADDLTIAPPPHRDPAQVTVRAGGTGLTFTGPGPGTRWRSLQDGRETTVDWCPSGPSGPSGVVFHGDSMACGVGADYVSADNTGPLTIRDLGSGKSETLTAPAGRAWMKAFSPTQVLAAEVDKAGWLTLHLIGRENEPRKDVTVTSPDRFGTSGFRVKAFDTKGALVSYLNGNGGETVALLDFATAALRPVPLPTGVTDTAHTKFGLGSQWIAMKNSGTVTLRSRADGTVTRTLTVPSSIDESVQPVGDWLVAQVDAGLTAVPVTGGTTRVLLPRTGSAPILPGTDGAAFMVGGTDSGNWGVHRIAPGPDGAPVVKKAVDLPANPADRVGLALAQGRLAVGQQDPATSVQGYTASVSGPPTVTQTPAWTCDATVNTELCGLQDAPGARSAATGDGRFVSLSSVDTANCSACGIAVNVIDAGAGGTVRQVPLASGMKLRPGHIESVSGRYVLFVATENSASRLLVADIDAGRILDVKASSPSTLWGAVLWQPEGDKGVVAGTDLRTGQVTRRVDLGTGCKPYELMATADWFYSTCSFHGDGAAAFHTPSKKRIPLPFTPERHHVRLGDGYVVHQGGGGLEVYNLRSGAPVREHKIEQYVTGHGIDWTVDRFGGRLAYTDPKEAVHLLGVSGKTSPLAVIDQDTAATVDFKTAKSWSSRWWLSKPVSSWKLTVRNKTSGISTVVRSGGEARGLITPAWDGKNQSGAYLYTGDYEWTLTARPADGQTPELRTSGSVKVTGIPSRVVRPPAR